MNILRIATLWTPFEFWAVRTEPDYWHVVEGSSGEVYELYGCSSTIISIEGSSTEEIVLIGSESKEVVLEGSSDELFELGDCQ